MARSELFVRKQSGGMFSVANYAYNPGNIFFVDTATGSDSAGGGQNPDAPLATLDYAIGLCTANKGDRIYLAPNHAETVTGVGGVTADIAGIEIIGLGNYNSRPRLLMDGGTTVTFAVSAANVTIRNVLMASGHLLVAAGFNVTGKGCWLDQVEWQDNTTAENWGTPVKATGAANTADGLKVTNCRWNPLIASVNALAFVSVTDDIADLVIEDNFIVHEGTNSPLYLHAGTKVSTRMSIRRNFLSHKMTANDLAFDNGGSGNSGIISNNRIGHADVTGGHVLGAVAGCRFFDNLSVSTDALSGFVIPAIDVDL
jgi:hypothetical protein